MSAYQTGSHATLESDPHWTEPGTRQRHSRAAVTDQYKSMFSKAAYVVPSPKLGVQESGGLPPKHHPSRGARR